MTGPLLFARQHSSTVGHPVKGKMSRPKLRRASSADDHNSVEVSLEHKEYRKKFFSKSDQAATSDADSGIEDLDQQLSNVAIKQSTNADEEEIFGACEDEEPEENTVQEPLDSTQGELDRIRNDLVQASLVPDHEKKNFCSDTSEVFHGEFAWRISCLIAMMHPGCRYYLFSEEEVTSDPTQWEGFEFVKLDNAKAQFKCPNRACGRLWTSMRARISFVVSRPQSFGFVVLKIYGQNCEACQTPAEALWYMDEVCRVMKNLAECISQRFQLSIVEPTQEPTAETIKFVSKSSGRLVHHDPTQRKGKMRAPHNRNHCEACLRGWCFE